MNNEQKDHYSPERNHWCIVEYLSGKPFYYAGYYGKNSGDKELKPAFTIDFNQALKCHSKIAAEQILSSGKRHSTIFDNCKVEDHKWM